MTDPAKRERAALDVLALLPDHWALGPTSYDPGNRALVVHRPWTASRTRQGARDDHRHRQNELAAMTDLRLRLNERHNAGLADIDRRGRAAFLEGAETQSQAAEGRPLTADELERVNEAVSRRLTDTPNLSLLDMKRPRI